ncbi:sensor domain-containing diguanylate cyclase [Burkholderia sp. Ac-20379]|uniref:sensor domain-containing diguanylate cyclase n=1 Tax=Burkholderia sp. Ac-20379 TaxID=2703900 RepID=UPI00198248EC|nr:diguanylate cyclase [Burkholderia sp. Ac-20379]MBN3728380.1 diguanylate cyclase [Burkholderia sp. Ac-20379]
MSDWPNTPVPFMDGIAICVATIGRDMHRALVVTAANHHFFEMMGVTGEDMPAFPIPLDVLAADFALRDFREQLLVCFGAGESPQMAWSHDFRADTEVWRLSLEPVRHLQGGKAIVREVMVTGFDVATKLPPNQETDVKTARYRAVVNSAYDAIVTIDHERNITLFNRAAENMFGYSAAEIIGRPIETLLPEKYRAEHPARVQRFADSYQPAVRHNTPPRMDGSNSVFGQHRNGSIIPVEIALSRIDVNGATEFTAVVRDITDRALQMELLKQQATTDALTGLPNRRGFMEFVESVLGSDEALSVFILDIDFFKDINDSHGHDAGDEVLRVLAQVGASMTHEPNVFARWGGEEFVAALPGADADRAHQVADQLRQCFERQDFEHPWRLQPIPFTVSIGVVARETGEDDVEALMRRADRALYRAKQSGRNRVEMA